MAFLWANLPALSNAQNLDPNQVYTTGNIVQPTPQGGPTPWVNGVYQNNLTCWGWGNPGYCGPNAIVRPGGNINFSFGMTDLHQVQAIANVLPNTGSGLRINGYDFGFTAKNGNGWDNGRTDYLLAYVSLYDSKGSLEYSKNYDLNYKFNWTNFNFSETFTSPFATKNLGNVRYGFLGMDNNYWAGPYGPEVNSVSFSLKYSVDPCSVDVLSSPSCPGYLGALNKITSPSTAGVTNDSTTSTITPTITTTLGLSAPTTTTAEVVTATSVAPTSTGGSTTTGAGTTTPTPVSVVSSTPVKVGEVSDSAKSAQPAVSLSTILSIVSSEQSRIGNLERSVVLQAVDQATKEAEKAQKDAEKLAGDSQQQSIAMSVQSNMSQTNPTNFGAQSTLFSNINTGAPQNQSMGAAHGAGPLSGIQGPTISFFSSGTENGIGVSAFRQEQNNAQGRLTAPVVVAAVPQVSYSLLPPSRSQQLIEIDLPRSEPTRFGARPMIEEIGRSMPSLPQSSSQSNQSDTVKRDVQNNELAGAVDIASIATQPRGYAQYNVGMPDSAFYEPKEIYRNQRTVDNARVLRGLMSGSDRLHQEMVNQQYK